MEKPIKILVAGQQIKSLWKHDFSLSYLNRPRRQKTMLRILKSLTNFLNV